MSSEVTNKIFTLPNLISIIRLVLVPIFAVLLVAYENNIAAFILFVIAASTDFLDGAIARGTGQVSRLGQQLDPFVDRVLILTAVILVFLLGRIPLWILLVIVARDLCMLVLLGKLRANNMPKLEVAFVGKAGTALNMAGFALLILYWPIVPGLGIVDISWLPGWGVTDAPLGIWFIYCGMVLAWAAGVYYIVRAHNDMNNKNNGSRGGGSRDSRNSTAGRRSQDTRSARGNTGRYDALQQRYAEENLDGTRGSARGGSAYRSGKRTAQHSRAQAQRGGRAASARGGTQANVLQRVLNTPTKIIAAIAAFLLVAVTLGFYGCDAVTNYGVIHAGVRVGTVEVGGMTTEDAAKRINVELNEVAGANPVIFFKSEEAAQAGQNEATVQLGNGVNTYDQTEVDKDASSWSITLGSIDAEVNGNALAQEAYAVGRNGDFFLGRIAASLFGVTVTPRVDYSAERLGHIQTQLTESIGTPMKNASISFDGTRFVAQDGQDGYVVDEENFDKLMQEAFFSENRAFVVPMIERQRYISLEEAQQVAQVVQDAIAEPVTVSYQAASWLLSDAQLGSVITAQATEDEQGSYALVPQIDVEALRTVLPQIIGQLENQIAPLDAEFVEVEGKLHLVPSQNGTGVNYERLAADLELVLFGASQLAEQETPQEDLVVPTNRTVEVVIGVLEPAFKTSDAESYDFSTMISQYTIEYNWVSQGTITNVHVAADLISSSVIAPQSSWSFIDTAGECTEERGFVKAPVILYDEYVDDIGGGLCNVATAVFNAAYEAGYPIQERINHSLRSERYPLGRDAAIAYPYADLKFLNDTDNYVLLTASYTDWSVTVTLWGIQPGYTVESVAGELVEGAEFRTNEVVDETLAPGQSYTEQEGKNASSVQVTRRVYYADGTLKEEHIFYSSYDSTPKIVKVGPNAD